MTIAPNNNAMSEILPRLRHGLDIMPSPVADSPGIILRDPFRYTPDVLLIPPVWVSALSLLDGRHTQSDLQAAMTRLAGGVLVRSEDIDRFIRTLRQRGFLETEEFELMKSMRHDEFRQASERFPAHAGSAYASDPVELSRQLREEFQVFPDPSPGSANGLLAIAAPHVSPGGGVESYSAAYKSLPNELADRTFVVLGTSHYGPPERFGMTRKAYKTPLGDAQVDVELHDWLAGSAADSIVQEDYCHTVEHSIEFQVVFLQQVFGPRIRILPILCGALFENLRTGKPPDSHPQVARFVEALSDLEASFRQRLFWVLGVDMAHVGARYGDGIAVTAGEGKMQQVQQQDHARLERLCAGDTDGFVELVQRNQDDLKWCGYSPFYVFMRAMKQNYPALGGQVRRYDQWNIDAQSVVSFGAMQFFR